MNKPEEAFHWIIDILSELNVPYLVIGGLAARAYGSTRDLADIDIEVKDKDIKTVASKVEEFITFGPGRYKDENWDLELLSLKYKGQEIDIAGEDALIFDKQKQSWEQCLNTSYEPNMLKLFGIRVPVVSLEALSTYKSKLARDVDLEDIRQIKRRF